MKLITALYSLFNISTFFCQEIDTSYVINQYEEVHILNNYQYHYNITLARIKKVYPLALRAKKLLESYDKELDDITKKRKKKKYSKEAQKKLKEEFEYSIKDLYISEGLLLLKLIHRETGLTVKEILKKYRNGFNATLYEQMAKIWGHTLDQKYDPYNEDWLIEEIIRSIEKEELMIETKHEALDKDSYKANMKEYRHAKKSNRKSKKEGKKKTHRKDESQ
jgi:hypothetical protein